ncbi:gamma-glutamyltransferase family protein [Oceanithermus sp.]
MDFDRYPYPSRRRVLFGAGGAVASSQPLAVSAGMKMLQLGGNAVDATVAMAAALVVVEPTSNGLGSDAFAIVSDGQKPLGLNASGPSPAGLPAGRFVGLERMPARGWPAVTVPGAVAAWEELHRRWGRLDWGMVLEPAIRYARGGFPVSPLTARAWRRAARELGELVGPEYDYFRRIYFPSGRAPEAGETWHNPDLATSLEKIAEQGSGWFYRGEFAEKLAGFAAASGGYISEADLSGYRPEWVEPLEVSYGRLGVLELPPNGQGLAALLALNILRELPLEEYPRESPEAYHLQIEAMKLAFADVYGHVADPEYMQIDPAEFLSPEYARSRARLIGRRAISQPLSGLPRGGTVYLAAAAGDLAVSFIQSNYMGFGSFVAVPGTGVSLQNRGAGFSTRAGHPNLVAPSKRPFHTIIPGFLKKDGRTWGPFGLMGGPMQPQGHVQIVVNIASYDMNPQAALDAPRWRVSESGEVWLEPGVSRRVIDGLEELGHRLRIVADELAFGKGQVILRHGQGWMAASEPRADGQAQVY